MNDQEVFSFGDPASLANIKESAVATIPRQIESSEELLKVLYEKLDLPGYFGFNWNALYDCLRDLHWIKEQDVVLIHEDLPALGTQDLSIYLEVLEDSVRSWGPGEEHRFIVVFPEALRKTIASIPRYSG
jgi:RNAse (barnase) inhibitor barstar